MLLLVGWTSRRRLRLAPEFRPAAGSDIFAKGRFSDCRHFLFPDGRHVSFPTVGVSCFQTVGVSFGGFVPELGAGT
jgi:hypothetical protein